jgi:hypothetical protein
MTEGGKKVAWGPIPSRMLSQFCIRNGLLVFRNGGSHAKKRGKYSIDAAFSLLLQLVASVLFSWAALNIFADFGPMKYTSSNGVRYSHSDWALQSVDLIQNIFICVLTVGFSLVKFCIFLAILKKRYLKIGPTLYALILVLMVTTTCWIWYQLGTGITQYNLFISSSLEFAASLVAMSSLLFLGIDSFRIIRVGEQ